MKTDTIIKCMPFEHIPKFPDDIDYCAFDLLKQALSKRKRKTLDGFWKVLEDKREPEPLKSL